MIEDLPSYGEIHIIPKITKLIVILNTTDFRDKLER